MTDHPTSLSKYLVVDTSSMRLTRLWARVAPRVQINATRFQWRALVYSVLALAFCIGAVMMWHRREAAPASLALVATSFATQGELLQIALADGSRLELTKESRLDVLPSEPHSTRLRLERGSIVCDMVPQRGRSFSIAVADLEVQVVGTLFRVSLDSARRVSVTVDRGAVTIRGLEGFGAGRTLSAGEHWSMVRAQLETASSASSEQASVGNARELPTTAPNANILGEAVGQPSVRPAGSTASREVASKAPDATQPAMLFERANQARRAGDAVAAALEFQTLITRFPTDPRVDLAAFELGRLRSRLGDARGAVAAFTTAIQRARSATLREDAMAHLVSAYAASGQVPMCRKQRETYQKTYPKGVHAALVSSQCPDR